MAKGLCLPDTSTSVSWLAGVFVFRKELVNEKEANQGNPCVLTNWDAPKFENFIVETA